VISSRWEASLEHKDHVELLRKGVPGSGGIWADFGSGEGAFTLALADLAGPEAKIYSIDKDRRALARQGDALKRRFPNWAENGTSFINADFSRPIDLPPLDGLVMANSLHFHRAKLPLLQLLKSYLRPGGVMILVEYNTDSGNIWVPHPISFNTWKKLAAEAGFEETRLLATYPSRFLREIYSAISR
jgi:SAM-dependent methyltransferase